MPKYRVTFEYDEIIEADDEGDALMSADSNANFMSNARVEELEEL